MSQEISEIRESATQAIITLYRHLVDDTDMTIEEIKKYPPGHDAISDQVMKASAIIGKPQTAMLGFALSGYTNETDMCYTVICLMDDAEKANALAGKVQNIISNIETHHARMN